MPPSGPDPCPCPLPTEALPHDVEAWLVAKRMELHARRLLEQHAAAADWLLIHPEADGMAAAHGLELRRPAADTYVYENDRALARLLDRQRNLSAQVLEKQKAFRLQCREGQRQVDVDFVPARQLTARLLQVDAHPIVVEPPSLLPCPTGPGTPQQDQAVPKRRPPEVRVITRRLPRPWMAGRIREPTPEPQ